MFDRPLRLETVVHKVHDNIVYTVCLNEKSVSLKYDGRIKTVCSTTFQCENAALESFNALVSAAKWKDWFSHCACGWQLTFAE